MKICENVFLSWNNYPQKHSSGEFTDETIHEFRVGLIKFFQSGLQSIIAYTRDNFFFLNENLFEKDEIHLQSFDILSCFECTHGCFKKKIVLITTIFSEFKFDKCIFPSLRVISFARNTSNTFKDRCWLGLTKSIKQKLKIDVSTEKFFPSIMAGIAFTCLDERAVNHGRNIASVNIIMNTITSAYNRILMT